jgi:ESCRT-II complex subunit VPS25
MAALVAKNLAVYEPAKQTRAVLLYWRLPEEWADVLHSWVSTSFHHKFNDLLLHIGNSDRPAKYYPHFL